MIPIVNLKACMQGGLPTTCTTAGAPCGVSGGTCVDTATLGAPLGMYCIKPCT
ncbi:MAG TPA: hypothetical protein VF331_08955 [Polyangiales bacterium]